MPSPPLFIRIGKVGKKMCYAQLSSSQESGDSAISYIRRKDSITLSSKKYLSGTWTRMEANGSLKTVSNTFISVDYSFFSIWSGHQ
jgi:hypothetical protein